MTSKTFEISLEGTSSPNRVTKKEFDDAKAILMASYSFKLNDAVTFNIRGGRNPEYSRSASVTPSGVEQGKVGIKLDPTRDWQLQGNDAVAYFTVSRNGTPIPGQSHDLNFFVEEK
ncbi:MULTISPECIES: hypothetical protein [unclassified Pseudomonas]|jgi:hypothetical protein|uniref:hypothetical protein n=1 Tax=unclassified Pseudomonas TaxID=196821 RepID=UPI00235E1F84|nr:MULTISPECIES: hypothetical protein [unclassified Pseudomonas]MDD1005545.1 hypothetical protein [Pseudomonas sp. TNT2022 ID642]MDT3313999.1 hypothetical protein [Pseudomonas sp. rhizo66]